MFEYRDQPPCPKGHGPLHSVTLLEGKAYCCFACLCLFSAQGAELTKKEYDRLRKKHRWETEEEHVLTLVPELGRIEPEGAPPCRDS